MAEAIEQPNTPEAASLVPLTDEPLADRLERLERSIAGLQSAEMIEQQVAARVMARLQSSPGANGQPPLGLVAAESSGVGGFVPASIARGALAAGAATIDRGLWGHTGLLGEFRLMFRMYVDPRYRLSRLGQFGVPAILGLMVLNYFFTGSVPFVGFLLERIVLVVLAVGLYKVLARDAARYRDVLDYLARYGG